MFYQAQLLGSTIHDQSLITLILLISEYMENANVLIQIPLNVKLFIDPRILDYNTYYFKYFILKVEINFAFFKVYVVHSHGIYIKTLIILYHGLVYNIFSVFSQYSTFKPYIKKICRSLNITHYFS